MTGRAGLGGVQFADTPDEAEAKARRLLGMKVGNYVVDRILVEEKLAIASEYFVGLVLDDALKQPVLVFSPSGGTGVEEMARLHPEKVARQAVDVLAGFPEYKARNMLIGVGVGGGLLPKLADFLSRLYRVARSSDARSAEVNPLVVTADGAVIAADCHLVVDDYAVYRHPELGIEIAREFDRPPTELERIAYRVEEKDYRGTFYFFQMSESPAEGDRYIGFHGAGGGGSMMSMDAVLNRGFKLANYCDTSGNPPASKVYRAAKVILSQPGIRGYFASGSGVASQEQYHSARGLVKLSTRRVWPSRPSSGWAGISRRRRSRSWRPISSRPRASSKATAGTMRRSLAPRAWRSLVSRNPELRHEVRPLVETAASPNAYAFYTLTGRLSFDHTKCPGCQTKGCVTACAPGILKLENGLPVLAIAPEDAKKGKCTECLACEIFCKFHELDAIIVHLPVPGLKEYRERVIAEAKAAGPAGKSANG